MMKNRKRLIAFLEDNFYFIVAAIFLFLMTTIILAVFTQNLIISLLAGILVVVLLSAIMLITSLIISLVQKVIDILELEEKRLEKAKTEEYERAQADAALDAIDGFMKKYNKRTE